MKQLSTIAIGILLMPFISSAQELRGDQDLSASYGRESGTDMIRGFSGSRSRPNSDYGSYNSSTFNSGNIFLTYRYLLCNRLALSATMGAEFVSFDHFSNNVPRNEPAPLLGQYKASITTFAIEVKPIYYSGRMVQLYGLVGLGGRYYHEQQVSGQSTGEILNAFPNLFFNSQWTPIGVQVGKKLSGFAELGLGYKGLVNAGVCYRFNRKTAAKVAKPE
jgi:hypothetical protein